MESNASIGNRVLLKANVTRYVVPGLLQASSFLRPQPSAQGEPLPSPRWFSLQLIQQTLNEHTSQALWSVLVGQGWTTQLWYCPHRGYNLVAKIGRKAGDYNIV